MNTRTVVCIVLATVFAVTPFEPVVAGGKKELAKAAMARLLSRDAARDAATVARARAVPATTTVWRYTTADQARRELRGGILPGKHFTPGVTRGRPPSATTAQRQYGLPQPPQVRLTVRLDKGTTVLRNKALGGQPGRGELVTKDPLPPTAIRRAVNLQRQGE